MRLLILSASAGAGHVQAAKALEESARLHFPKVETLHADILDHASKLYKKAYAGSYLRMIDSAPNLWGVLYRASNRSRPGGTTAKISRAYDKIGFASFRKFVREFEPDAVISTHFLACQLFGHYRKKGRDRFPLGIVITDFDVHGYWVEPSVDRYFVGNEELRWILGARGIDEKKVEVTGIPIAPKFWKSYDPKSFRSSLGFKENIPTLLIMSGGAGVGSMEEAVTAALEAAPVQVLAVAGRNEKLKQQLENLTIPKTSRLKVFGFVDNIPELMAAADFCVTKSGGLTSAECLAMGLPMIVRDPVPGQEEKNCDYLVESGVAVKAQGISSLRYKLKMLLNDPTRLRSMRESARKIAKPKAALQILEKMLS